MGSFTSKFNPATDLLDLHGKVAIVTGGNAGIGFWTVAHLSRRGAKVYLAARNESKVTGALTRLKTLGFTTQPSDGEVLWLPLDLSDPREVKQVAEGFIRKEDRLDILVNNAGLMASPYQKTKDGIVDTMVVNHISPFVLVSTLSPLLEKTAREKGSDIRIVTVASLIHKVVKDCKFDSIESFNTVYGTSYMLNTKRYAQSKLANILWNSELQRHYDARGVPITCISLSPGSIHTDTAVEGLRSLPLGGLIVWLTRAFSFLPEEGSFTSLFAAASPLIRRNPSAYRGKYIVPFGKLQDATEVARDQKLAETLWRTTEDILQNVYHIDVPRV